MYCGLFFHAGLIYGAGYEWRVTSDQTSALLSFFANFIHHFRMEAFYLLSGFFYLMVFEKGRRGFLQDKLLRALVPMLIVGFTLNTYMNQLSYNYSFNWNWSYIQEGKWLSHLWFLGNLVMYFVVAWPVCKLLQPFFSHISEHHQTQNGEWLTNRERQPLLIWCLAILLAFSITGQFLTNRTDMKTFVFINLLYFAYYFGYFLMGVVAYKLRNEFFKLIHIRSFPIFITAYALLQITGKVDLELNEGTIYFCKLLSHFPLMLAAFSVLCFIGSKEISLIRSLSDASYTVYLLHQPLLIIFYVFFFEKIALGALPEYLLLTSLIFIIPLLLHLYVIKKSKLMMLLLNGDTRLNTRQPYPPRRYIKPVEYS